MRGLLKKKERERKSKPYPRKGKVAGRGRADAHKRTRKRVGGCGSRGGSSLALYPRELANGSVAPV
jgi:hypothetical protein